MDQWDWQDTDAVIKRSTRAEKDAAEPESACSPTPTESEGDETRLSNRDLRQIISGWQKHCERMGKLLGCMGIDEDVEEAVATLTRERTVLREAAEAMVCYNCDNRVGFNGERRSPNCTSCRRLRAALTPKPSTEAGESS